MKEILLNERKNISFVSDEELDKFDTFFHKDRQTRFLTKAKDYLEKRHAIAREIQSYASQLSREIVDLAKVLSAPPKEGSTTSQSCALLVGRMEEKTAYIRTNILYIINEYLLFIKNDSTFVQIEKEMFLLEIAWKALGETPPEWEKTKENLLAYPPQTLADCLSQILSQYDTLEHHVTAQLLAAAKAAKTQNLEKYLNLLNQTVVALYDSAVLIKGFGTDK